MGRSQRLRDADYRAVHRLLSDLREMRHDRPAMHQHLVDSLVGLVGATGGFVADVSDWKPAPPGGLRWDLAVTSFTVARPGADVVSKVMSGLAYYNNPWDDPTFALGVQRQGAVESLPFHGMMAEADVQRDYPHFAQVRAEAGYVDHLITWFQKAADGVSADGDVFGVSLHRYGHGERLFAGREVALVRLLYEELHWLHATGRLTPAVPSLAKLPPRLRQVLDGLLGGQPPKRIARDLGLSVLTVRDHIKRLYAIAGVSGRDELMSQYIRTK
jgi:DNA-binding CsgD family transcriptional regulator